MSNYSSSKFKEDSNTPWYKVFNLIKDKQVVLDIGCSSGNFGKELIDQKHCTVDGVELNLDDARLAKKKLRKVFSFNIEEGAPKELWGQYDVVCFGDVIEHLVNPVVALENTKQLLKKNGKVVFSIPNMAHMSVRLMLLGGNFEYGETGLLDKTHLHFYDEKEVYRVFNEASLNIDKIDYVRRDIPTDVLKRILATLGLKADKSFIENSKKVNASAYQFIGISSMSQKSDIKQRPKLSPAINEMEQHIKYIKDVHAAQIKAHKKRINELESQVTRLSGELEGIKNNKGYKLLSKIASKKQN